MRSNRPNINDSDVVKDYVENQMGIERISLKYRTSMFCIRQILAENNVKLRPKHVVPTKSSNGDYDNPPEGFHYVARCKEDGKEFDDYTNKSGCLIAHIKNVLKIEIPSLYKRHGYFAKNGKLWYEQWFEVVLKENEEPKETKSCPYCGWTTIDVTNRSGVFEQHLKQTHQMTVEEHLKNYPEDKPYFTNQASSVRRRIHEYDKDNYVTCKICGAKLARIDWKHLDKHGITLAEYKKKYGLDSTLSHSYRESLVKNVVKMNLALENNPEKFTSKGENEIKDYIKSLGIECGKNRSILHGKELDIFIPSQNIAIEFNGNVWHTEKFGKKDRHYHLNKLNECNDKGVKLIQIFEDEYEYHKNIVFNKLKHILKADFADKPKIMGRKCEVHEISNELAWKFLDENHIQGGVNATVYIGAFHNDELVGVVTFLTEGNDKWNLTRLATANRYRCQGLASKMFSFFIKNYNPVEIKSFADRRWTTDSNDNLYTKLGFKLCDILKPDYRYFSSRLDRFKRFHKFGFRKDILSKRYGLDEKMTESEMAEALKLDKIWDCGLFKYIWNK